MWGVHRMIQARLAQRAFLYAIGARLVYDRLIPPTLGPPRKHQFQADASPFSKLLRGGDSGCMRARHDQRGGRASDYSL